MSELPTIAQPRIGVEEGLLRTLKTRDVSKQPCYNYPAIAKKPR
jgi:hypothetical protein